MGSGAEERGIGAGFDSAMAAALVVGLRQSFASGRTRSHEWRAAQLKGIARMIDEKESAIMAALHEDLAKPQMESYLHEVPESSSLKIAPTLLLDVPHDSSIMKEEIFGPFLPIVTVRYSQHHSTHPL
ncbi:hypothetical protein GW17_00037796 [Ensete ventricosum]|nr:hypothetical protein GW17_00037796 [Ensete ventricosum]